jgi:hypothetical protein
LFQRFKFFFGWLVHSLDSGIFFLSDADGGLMMEPNIQRSFPNPGEARGTHHNNKKLEPNIHPLVGCRFYIQTHLTDADKQSVLIRLKLSSLTFKRVYRRCNFVPFQNCCCLAVTLPFNCDQMFDFASGFCFFLW